MSVQIIAVVPSKQKTVSFLIGSESKVRRSPSYEKAVEFLAEYGAGTTLIGPMGGPGQAILMRAVRFGITVARVPFHRLREISGFHSGMDTEVLLKTLHEAYASNPEAFYVASEYDPAALEMRTLTRSRRALQTDLRIKAQLILQTASREFGVLGGEGKRFEKIMTFYANPSFIDAAKKDEETIERFINTLLAEHPIWDYVRGEAVASLPRIIGLGPSLGGSIIGEIGDIRRFPSPLHLRSYARFGLTAEGKFPSRKRGEVAPFSPNLFQAVWLWSTSQVLRYEGTVWKDAYLFFKAEECQAHPEVVERNVQRRDGSVATAYDYTLKHLHLRACRKLGSLMLEYLWGLWTSVVTDASVTDWYAGSGFPEQFANMTADLDGGLRVYLEEQVQLRRRVEPETEENENE